MVHLRRTSGALAVALDSTYVPGSFIHGVGQDTIASMINIGTLPAHNTVIHPRQARPNRSTA